MLKLIEAIKGAKCVGCLTGAGVSTLCGIPDFRGPQGLYKHRLNFSHRLRLPRNTWLVMPVS